MDCGGRETHTYATGKQASEGRKGRKSSGHPVGSGAPLSCLVKCHRSVPCTCAQCVMRQARHATLCLHCGGTPDGGRSRQMLHSRRSPSGSSSSADCRHRKLAATRRRSLAHRDAARGRCASSCGGGAASCAGGTTRGSKHMFRFPRVLFTYSRA